MATALIKSILQAYPAQGGQLHVFDVDATKCLALSEDGVTVASSAETLAQAVDYLFLAVKPQQMFDALATIAGHLAPGCVVVSIAAGITGESIQRQLAANVSVVLAMPNMPILLGAGATALAAIPPTSPAAFSFVCDLFACSGTVSVIAPEQMNDVIPLNGSSPAFLYEIARHFLQYGEQVGLDPTVARSLFAQTMVGAAKMITESGEDLTTLIDRVSSPGGTTLAGLSALRQYGLGKAIQAATHACAERAYELGAELNRDASSDHQMK